MKHKYLKLSLLAISTIFFINLKAQKMRTASESKIIDAPISLVWDVISEVENYHHYANSLHDVKIISGDSLGMVRQCSDNEGNSWQESCTAWEPEKYYTFNVHTHAKDFSLPFKHFEGTWLVEAVGENKTKLTLTFKYKLKHRWIMWLFIKKMKREGRQDILALLDNWEQEIMKRKNS
jgi:ribosome-associated toxin RatA of RatAB toxin-antitoxin module